jgi:mevalonate kinase
MSYDFLTTTHGKWILAGEHTVLRGGEALVFPAPKYQLTLAYKKSDTALEIKAQGNLASQLPAVVTNLFNIALKDTTLPHFQLQGDLNIQNTIPLGVGMGGSAALCVAVARFLSYLELIPNASILTFAHQLEHHFHGKSSGLDIAGVHYQQGMIFKSGQATALNQQFKPNWFLSSSGEYGKTSRCIAKVQSLWEKDLCLGEKIDNQMKEATGLCRQALEQGPKHQPLLIQGINQARQCFSDWGLVTPKLEQHMAHLLEEGAVAVKPTGSGGGGYVLSLWPGAAPPITAIKLLEV